MLERLVEFVHEFWEALCPLVVIDAFERGLVLRFGRFQRLLEPGAHWRWPLAERVMHHWVCAHTNSLTPQSLTTQDGHQVVVALVLTWRVNDLRKFLLDVENGASALADSAYGSLARFVAQSTWSDLSRDEAEAALGKEIRRKAFRWGVEVMNVQFRDLTRCKSLRIWQAQVYE